MPSADRAARSATLIASISRTRLDLVALVDKLEWEVAEVRRLINGVVKGYEAKLKRLQKEVLASQSGKGA